MKPLNKLKIGIQKFSSGDLSYVIKIPDENEFGEIANVVNQMEENMLKDRIALKELAIRDGLTGLYNHQEFYFRLESEISYSKRHGHHLSLVMMDIDNFKGINDTYGHLVGDKVLKEVARILLEYVRSSDVVCRYGGEEFTVILPETDTKEALETADRIKRKIEEFRITDEKGKIIYVTVSIGVATYPKDGTTSRLLLNNADHALYAAKLKGKNRVVSFNEIACSRESTSF